MKILVTGGCGFIGSNFILGGLGGSNPLLASMEGLENLTYIGGNLTILSHEALESLSSLNALITVGGSIWISGNDSLTSLTGLDYIDAASIVNLKIIGNPLLSTCEVESICSYLVAPAGTVDIHDNAPGCNSQEEMEDACLVSVNEINPILELSISPNPASTQITIEVPVMRNKNTLLTIFNMNSQLLLTQRITNQKTQVDISGLPAGLYFLKVSDERTVRVGKMIKK